MKTSNVSDRVRAILEPLVATHVEAGLDMRLADDGDTDLLRPTIGIGTVSTLTSATITRTPHVSEGTARRHIEVDLYLSGRNEVQSRISDFLEELAVLMRQDQTIQAEGGDPSSPAPRHHLAHPFVARLVKAWGWDMATVVRPASAMFGTTIMIARSEKGVYTEMMTQNEGHAITLSREIERRVLRRCELTIQDAGPGGLAMEFRNEITPCINISGVELPGSAIALLEGAPLGRLIGGPRLAAVADLVIQEVWTERGAAGPTTWVRLEDVLVPLEDC